MKIYFVEVESSERQFFESELADQELHFVSNLQEVEADAEIVSTFIYSRIDGPFLDRHAAVRLIATRSTTHDHLELESCAERGVTMCIVPSYGDHVVAEHTFALLLAVARRLRESMTSLTRPYAVLSFAPEPLESLEPGALGYTRFQLPGALE